MTQARDKNGKFASKEKSDNGLTLVIDPDLIAQPYEVPKINDAILIGMQIGDLGTVYGGPYLQKPKGMIGVNLAEEIDAPSDLKMGIRDFSTPRMKDMEELVLHLIRLLHGHGVIYMGCMGGRGRTGLAMACLLKAVGVSNPVKVVRDKYNSHAVETPAQEALVDSFPAEKFEFILKFLK